MADWQALIVIFVRPLADPDILVLEGVAVIFLAVPGVSSPIAIGSS